MRNLQLWSLSKVSKITEICVHRTQSVEILPLLKIKKLESLVPWDTDSQSIYLQQEVHQLESLKFLWESSDSAIGDGLCSSH